MSAIKKTFEFTLDLRRRSDVQLKGMVEGDTGNVFVIHLTEDGRPLAQADVNASRVILKIKPSSGGSWASQDSATGEDSGISIADGTITIQLFADTFSSGWNTATLEVYTDESGDDDILVTTQRFQFEADHGGRSELHASKEYPALIEAVNRLNAIIDQIRYPSMVYRDASTHNLVVEFSDGQKIDVGALVAWMGNNTVGENLLYNGRPHKNDIGGEVTKTWTVFRNRSYIQIPEIIEGDKIRVMLPASPDDNVLQLERIYAQASAEPEHGTKYFPYADWLRELTDGEQISVNFEIKTSNYVRVGVSVKTIVDGVVYAAIDRERSTVLRPSDDYTTMSFSGTVPQGWHSAIQDPDRAYMVIDLRTTASTDRTEDIVADIRKVKVERGRANTEWCPSYKDLEDLISSSVRFERQTLTETQRGRTLANLGFYYGASEPEDVIDLLNDGDFYLQIADPVEFLGEEELSEISEEADSGSAEATMEAEEG